METYHTLERIADVLGVSKSTIFRWGRDYGFPICKTPAGTCLTTSTLIDSWIQDTRRAQIKLGDLKCQREKL